MSAERAMVFIMCLPLSKKRASMKTAIMIVALMVGMLGPCGNHECEGKGDGQEGRIARVVPPEPHAG